MFTKKITSCVYLNTCNEINYDSNSVHAPQVQVVYRIYLFFFHVLCVCVCVCVCGHVYVVYEDTNLYNDMGMTGITRRR